MDELHSFTAKNGSTMRNLVISMVTSSSRNERITASDDMSRRSEADSAISGSSGGSSIDTGHQNNEHLIALWQRLVNEGLPIMDEMCSNDEAALASTAWMSEMVEAVGWENALATFC